MSTEEPKKAKTKEQDNKSKKLIVRGPKKGIKGGTVTILFALIKMSGIGITEISGKLGGNVFSRTKGGAIIRNRVVGSNPQTIAQQQVRAIFGAISSAWRTLTAAQRDSWNAITGDYPYTNRLGETKLLSGKALFQKLNNNLLYAGKDLATNPTTPEGVNAPVSTSSEEVLIDASGEVMLSFVLEGLLATNNDFTTIVVLEATAPLSPGVKNANAKFVRLGQSLAINGEFAFNTPTLYTNVFGVPSGGAQVQMRVFSVNPNTGEKSAVFKTSATVEQDA